MLCRGDFYYADLSPVVGCEQGGVRPVLIVQNNVGNRYSPTVIVAAVTSRMEKHPLPTHVFINRIPFCKRIPLLCWNKFAQSISQDCWST